MIVVPTQKMYFKRFTHCVKIAILHLNSLDAMRGNSTIKKINDYLSKNNVAHRTRLDWNNAGCGNVKITYSVYFNDTATYNYITDKYKKVAVWASKPIDDIHIDLLRSNTEILFREKLLYNKFRYRINFDLGWKREFAEEVNSWIASQFADKTQGTKGDYMKTGYWSLTLYLVEDDDLIMTKLSLADRIKSIVRVERFSDHGITLEDLAVK